jgi:hypothetical protein
MITERLIRLTNDRGRGRTVDIMIGRSMIRYNVLLLCTTTMNNRNRKEREREK